MWILWILVIFVNFVGFMNFGDFLRILWFRPILWFFEFCNFFEFCDFFVIFVIFLGYHQCKFGYGSLNRTKQVLEQTQKAQCLKIPQKVAFNITSYGATFTFWVDKSSLKMPKIGQFWLILENLEVKQCYQTGLELRLHFEWTKVH